MCKCLEFITVLGAIIIVQKGVLYYTQSVLNVCLELSNLTCILAAVLFKVTGQFKQLTLRIQDFTASYKMLFHVLKQTPVV